MQVRSLGFRTDLMLRTLGGACVADRGGWVVVRTPGNPGFWWGNCLLLPGPIESGTADTWEAVFVREFPEAEHRAFGVDGTDGAAGDPDALAALGVEVEASVVLTADAHRVPEPADLPGTAYRPLASGDDWDRLIDLRLVCDEGEYPDTPAHRDFVRRKRDETRAIVQAGRGAWFGAFTGRELVAGLGIFSDGSGLARYQTVETHPAYRRRGHARRLLAAAARYAVADLGARTLVIVADPDYHAIELYRSVGFVDAERQVQLQRRPGRLHCDHVRA